MSATLLASMTFSGAIVPASAAPASEQDVVTEVRPTSPAAEQTRAPSTESTEAEPKISELQELPPEVDGSDPALAHSEKAKDSNESEIPEAGEPVADLPAPQKSPRAMMAARLVNPDLPVQCGLSVAVVMDLSNSLTDSHVTSSKKAAKSVVDSLQGTPSSVGVYTFATYAPDRTNAAISNTAVSTDAGASSVKNAIDRIKRVPSNVGGTNWDAALRQIPQGEYDIVLFVTDGNPTAYGTPHQNGRESVPRNNTDFGTRTDPLDLSTAELAADELKSSGSFVLGLAVGSDINLGNIRRISGAVEGTDYFTIQDYDQLGEKLSEIALKNCMGTVSVVKQVRDLEGNLAPAEGWVFSGRTADKTSPAKATTGADGAVNFQVEDFLLATRTVGFTEEQKTGFEIEQQSGANATCVNNATGKTVSASNLGTLGFTVDVQRDSAISCQVINRMIPAEPIVRKESNPASGTEVKPGEDVTYTLTFDNEGSYPADVDYTDHLSGVIDDSVIISGPASSDDGLTAVLQGDRIQITGKVKPHQPITVTYSVQVKAEDFNDGWLRNFVRPTGEDPPALCADEDLLCTEHPIPGVLEVEKTSEPGTDRYVAPGDTINYTLTFRNAGATTLNVDHVDRLADVLDDAEFLEGTLSADNGLTAVRNGNQIAITGEIGKENVATVTYSVKVKTAEFGNGVARNFLVPEGINPPEECVPEEPCTEHPILGTLIWEKSDSGDSLLAGSEWKLTGPNGDVLELEDCTAKGCANADRDPTAGQFRITGLEWGQYTLIETRAPAGYLLSDTEYKIVIQGGTDPAELVIDLGRIENEQRDGLALPLTGGLGSDEFLIGGGLALAAALGIVTWKRRKSASDLAALDTDG